MFLGLLMDDHGSGDLGIVERIGFQIATAGTAAGHRWHRWASFDVQSHHFRPSQ
jgi:hypothetical protein